jgi:ERCC4-related helicase
MLCFAVVEGANFIMGKESSGSGNWRNVQRTGRNGKERKGREKELMKGR